MPRLSSPSVRFSLAAALAVLGVALCLRPASAQDVDGVRYKLLFSFKKDDTAPGQINLRPNVGQEVFVHIEHDSDADEEVTIQLLDNGKAAFSQKVKAVQGKRTQVVFTAPAGAPAPALKDLKGEVSFRVLNKAGKFDKGFDSPLRVARPRTYIAPSSLYAPGERGRFETTLEVARGILLGGPAIKAELDIDPAHIPNLLPGQPRSGRYAGFLVPSAPNASLTLEARNLRFKDARQSKGTVFVTLDGYKRALAYHTSFATSGTAPTPDLQDDPTLSLPLPAYSRPKKMDVAVHADGNIDWTDRVRVQVFAGFARVKGKTTAKKLWADLAEFRGPRQVKFRYQLGDNGGLLFVPGITEWKASLDFSGVFEPTEVRLTLVDKDGKEKKVRNGATRAVSGNEVIQGIVFDDTPPAVAYDSPPDVAYRGRSLKVVAQASDAESGISDVYFHLGKPTAPGGKASAEVARVPGVLEKGVYTASFLVPLDARGPFDVTVVASNRVGQSANAVLTLPVTDAPPDKASLAGRVFDADTPVENLPVLLLSDAGEELFMTRTAAGGKFVFKDLEPGRYGVFARRDPSGHRRLRMVAIKGKEQLVDQDLALEAPPVVIKAKEKPPEAKKKLKKGKIAGVVLEGERPQPGLKVTLSNAQGKALFTTTTNDDGAYEFKDLDKGDYAVSSAKSASFTRGSKTVGLGQGEEKKDADIKLYR